MSDSEFTVCALMEHYQLGEEVCSQQVTDRHLNEIASSYCRHWKSLRAELGLKAIVEHDIDHSLSDDEEGKRRALFNKWKLMKGFSATYKALISALLEIKCRDDAEGVCEVLKQSIGAREQELCHDTQDSCQTDERVGTGCSPKVDESAKVDTTIQQKMSKAGVIKMGGWERGWLDIRSPHLLLVELGSICLCELTNISYNPPIKDQFRIQGCT